MKTISIIQVGLLLMVIFIFSCKNNKESSAPSVPKVIYPVDGAMGVPTKEVSFEWCYSWFTNDSVNYTVYLVEDDTLGNPLKFQSSRQLLRISDLKDHTRYYWRISSSLGKQETISNWFTFTTENPDFESGIFLDHRDNKTYKYVKIGSQTWMAENLAYLPRVTLSTERSSDYPLYYVIGYERTDIDSARISDNYIKYGALYNWSSAMISCPVGWHLPSDGEWKILEMFLGMSEEDANYEGFAYSMQYGKDRSGNVGEKLKSIDGWKHGSICSGINGIDMTGFRVIPSGFIDEEEPSGTTSLGSSAFFWTSTEKGSNMAYARSFNFKDADRYYFGKKGGSSVRCVKD